MRREEKRIWPHSHERKNTSSANFVWEAQLRFEINYRHHKWWLLTEVFPIVSSFSLRQKNRNSPLTKRALGNGLGKRTEKPLLQIKKFAVESLAAERLVAYTEFMSFVYTVAAHLAFISRAHSLFRARCLHVTNDVSCFHINVKLHHMELVWKSVIVFHLSLHGIIHHHWRLFMQSVRTIVKTRHR